MINPNSKNFKGIAHNIEGVAVGAIYAEDAFYVVHFWKSSGGFSGEKSKPLPGSNFSFLQTFDNGFRVEKHYQINAH
jgi:hypothetical protein